jgi:PAS domain S-box-containing protein
LEKDRADWSPQLYKIFGVNPEHFKPVWTNFMKRIHPGDRARVKEQVSNSLKKGLDLEIEYRIVRPDGIVRHVRSSAETMTQANGKSKLIFGLLLDVTEEKRLRMELETNLLQLFRANRLASLGEMVTGVAHEINNPNSLITFNLPLMEDIWRFVKPIINEYAKRHPDAGIGKVSAVELSQDMDDIMGSLKKGSHRINQVVNKLKLFAASDEVRETQITDVNQVVEETMAIFKTKLKIHADKIALILEEGLPAIRAYPLKLEQVLGNLLINASHAISKKTNGMISITTRHSKAMGAVLVEVEDNGNGMTREQMGKIFDPFFTTRRQDGGTGLGLSISRGIVKEHHGIMGVLSRPDVGTRFTVFLPEEKGVEPALQPNLLIVDDDPSVLKLLKSNFIKIDKRFIQTLSEPESVLEYLAEHPEIDMVLSDIVMPHVNGWQLFKTINARFPLMPVILYSGSSQALDNPLDGIKPDFLIRKPFDRNMLIETVHQFSRLKL